MEDRETLRMRKYGESKTTRIVMATVPHVTSGSGLRKFQADGFLLDRVYTHVIRQLNKEFVLICRFKIESVMWKIIVGTVGGIRYLVCPTDRYKCNFYLSLALTYNSE